MGDRAHSIISYLRHRLVATSGGHGVHSPFVYALCENVFYSRERFYHFDELEKVRGLLLQDKTIIHAGNFGAGSKTFRGPERRVKDIASHGISGRRKSERLYRLANFIGATTCIELGTSLGVNTLYLARQNPSGKVVTIEGSSDLYDIAQKLARLRGITNIEFINGTFEASLPSVIDSASGITLVYIDGDHSLEGTLKYFELLRPLACGKNVFVFDDLYWSREMTRAWNRIAADPAVTLAIDTYFEGYVFFSREIMEKVSYRIAL